MGDGERDISPRRYAQYITAFTSSPSPLAVTEPAVPTLVFVGRIDPLKDIETLLRAFAEVRLKVPECRLRIFGPTPEGGEDYYDQCRRAG